MDEFFDECALRGDALVVEFAGKPRKDRGDANNLGFDGVAVVERVSAEAMRPVVGGWLIR